MGLGPIPKVNVAGVAAPTVTDDRDSGYSEGSRWIDTLTSTEYRCTDATVGEAEWERVPTAGIVGVAGLTATLGGRAGIQTPTRCVWREDFAQRPGLAGDIDPVDPNAPTQAELDAIFTVNRVFMVAGTNMTSALVTHSASKGGIVLTGAGADNDQALLEPRSNPAAGNRWLAGFDSDQKPALSFSFRLPSVDDLSVKLGFALTSAHDLTTDADQVGLFFSTDTGGNFLVHTSIGNSDATIDTGVTPAADTEYRVDIEINASRIAEVRINGALVARTLALTTNIALIPMFSQQARDAADIVLDLRPVTVSMEQAA